MLVRSGNEVSEVSARLCARTLAGGGFFSLENRERSWLWLMPCLLTLLAMDGVAMVLMVYTAFGTDYVKPTVFVHDSPTLYRLDVPPPSPPVVTVELRG